MDALDLYERSVQNPEADVEFLDDVPAHTENLEVRQRQSHAELVDGVRAQL